MTAAVSRGFSDTLGGGGSAYTTLGPRQLFVLAKADCCHLSTTATTTRDTKHEYNLKYTKLSEPPTPQFRRGNALVKCSYRLALLVLRAEILRKG